MVRKRRATVRRVSDRTKYRCSDGTILSQAEINERYSRVSFELRRDREPVCQGTGRTDLPLSISHTISRRRCKELGKSELIYDPRNLELESFEAPTSFPTAAHNVWEVGSVELKRKLLNFARKLAFIKEHDPEQYVKLTHGS